jgi:hypothetical protein
MAMSMIAKRIAAAATLSTTLSPSGNESVLGAGLPTAAAVAHAGADAAAAHSATVHPDRTDRKVTLSGECPEVPLAAPAALVCLLIRRLHPQPLVAL